MTMDKVIADQSQKPKTMKDVLTSQLQKPKPVKNNTDQSDGAAVGGYSEGMATTDVGGKSIAPAHQLYYSSESAAMPETEQYVAPPPPLPQSPPPPPPEEGMVRSHTVNLTPLNMYNVTLSVFIYHRIFSQAC